MLCGGEALSARLADRLLDKGAGLWNVYGPTETTIWSSAWRVEAGRDPISIGRPIANTQFYVLDKRLRPVPVGVIGELYIGGSGAGAAIAIGQALTAERFIPDPFGTRRADDCMERAIWPMACRRDAGMPRAVDHQVKIRGFRVELGEIEAALARHPAVREARLPAPDASGETDAWRRTSCSARRAGQPSSAADLRHGSRASFRTTWSLGDRGLEALPLTPNGKVDRRALPDPGQRAGSTATRRPRAARADRSRRRSAAVWAEVLGTDRVRHPRQLLRAGRPFAAGHAARCSRVRADVRGGACRCALFEAPTVAGLARQIDATLAAAAASGAADCRVPRERPAARVVRAAAALVPRPARARGAPTTCRPPSGCKARSTSAALQRALRARSSAGTRSCARRSPPTAASRSRSSRRRCDVAPAVDDLADLPEAEREAEGAPARGRGRRPFDLARGPLLRRRAACGSGRAEHVVAADDAPHRLRRLVDGRLVARARRAVRGVLRRASRRRCPSCRSSTPTTPSGSGAGSGRGAGAQLGYWRDAAGRPAAAGAADRPAAAGGAELARGGDAVTACRAR